MLALITASAVFILVIIVVLVAFLFGLILALAAVSPQERLMRERRRHAERTARAMLRMTEIRQQTAERMDRAEGRPR
ncbi:MAG TPA: hypothetical protein VFY36_06145 [Solirubrobacteraceae bacterium]|nr:hypothetical protein [Solirubrobacteraceae bacterium]